MFCLTADWAIENNYKISQTKKAKLGYKDKVSLV